MDKGYIHVEIDKSQVPKHTGAPSGDVVAYERTVSLTTIIVADGMGHGIKANIAAQLCVARMLELLRRGNSLRKAFAAVVNTMEVSKGTDLPYAVLTAVRILNDGVATVLTYEMPAPIFVTARYAHVLTQRTITLDGSLVGETNCHVAPGEGIIVVSDGITQAGLGMGMANGWTIEGVSQFISDVIHDGAKLKSLPGAVLSRACQIWKDGLGDDCSVVLASCRVGKTVNVLTGPSADQRRDKEIVKRFLMQDGTKVVSGGTTARIVADYLERPIGIEDNPDVMLAPARYFIDGIDLVTEGAVTLNQVYNIFDEDPETFDEVSGVTDLVKLLKSADQVKLTVGNALNPANRDISFRQRGILTRQAIIPLIIEKLESSGKLVVVENC